MTRGALHGCKCFGKAIACRMLPRGGPHGTGISCAIAPKRLFHLSSVTCLRFPRCYSDVVQEARPRHALFGNRPFDIISLSTRHAHLGALFQGSKCFCCGPRCVTFHTSAVRHPKFIRLRIIPSGAVPASTGGECFLNGALVGLCKRSSCVLASALRHHSCALLCGKKGDGGSPLHLNTIQHGLFCHGKVPCQRSVVDFMRRRLTRVSMFDAIALGCVPHSAVTAGSALSVRVAKVLSGPCSNRFAARIASGDGKRVNPKLSFDVSGQGTFRHTRGLGFRIRNSCR